MRTPPRAVIVVTVVLIGVLWWVVGQNTGYLSGTGDSSAAGLDPTPEDCRTPPPQNTTFRFGYLEPRTTDTVTPPAEDVPMFTVVTNRFGLRERSFPLGASGRTTRILVVGDSFTFGYGMNASQRFTDKTEVRLTDGAGRTVEVLNAGRIGYGMRDYYLALRHKLLRFDPDIVVIAFYGLDSRSRARDDRWKRRVTQRYNITRTELSVNDEAKGDLSDMMQAHMANLTWASSPIRRYGNRIAALTERHGATPVFFLIKPFDPPKPSNRRIRTRFNATHRVIEAWAAECGYRFRAAPTTIAAERYRFADGHYNSAGNTVLARTLTDALRPLLD